MSNDQGNSDAEARAAIALVLGSPTPPGPHGHLPSPPDDEGGSDFTEPVAPSQGLVEAPPPPQGAATTGPAGTHLPAGPTSIILRPTGADSPVAVTRRHLYAAVAGAILAAALVAGLVAGVVANRTSSTASPAPATRLPATTAAPSTSTSTTATPAVAIDPATLTLPVPRTAAAVGPYGAVARPGELVIVPAKAGIKGEPGTARWQWETCAADACSPVKGSNGDGYRVPAAAKAGTTIRAALTITPQGQKGRITAYTARVTIVV